MKIFYEDADLDPNYDESNADWDRYDREADMIAIARSEGVRICNIENENDPINEEVVNWNDCFRIRELAGNM